MRFAVLLLFFATLAFAGGFFAGNMRGGALLPQKIVSVFPQEQSRSFDFPVVPEILQSPLVYEWAGRLRANLLEKTDDSVVVGDDKGNKLTIYRTLSSGERWKATFDAQDPETGKYSEVSEDQIPVGSLVVVEFFVFSDAKDRPILSGVTKK